ncbi:elongation factor P--(R)-beta-lysine ligase [Thalassotalea sp. G2M2-11]|uniref:elongation factor P--(R)-beta-lysine ligase n=1 Tax=Thalassotalea sp. G2M2-11 TaxID=2787627 RepID=UPI0019D17A35|nr:elongation factor P--(R)-beta-lysine ligase [Thalassotalea sp. G2M2-11]
MSWQTNLSWELAKQRSVFFQQIRNFFEKNGVIEVETPILSQGTVTDVHLDAFKSRYHFLQGSEISDDHLYLQTSPEFAMKRLLASGYGSIYQICKAFRHEEAGRFHNPEFTMLEWYRIGYDHHQLMNEVSALLTEILGCEAAEKMSYQQAFEQILALDPLDVTAEQLKSCLSSEGIEGDWISSEQDVDVLLQVLFSECIEHRIGLEKPCLIYDYPSSQSALAKISQSDPRVADRFECYYKGVELANGFNELTDATEQLQRFERDNQQRIALGKKVQPIDNRFIEALTYGLPQCAGVALGIDRLFMLCSGADHIAKTMTFTVNNA